MEATHTLTHTPHPGTCRATTTCTCGWVRNHTVTLSDLMERAHLKRVAPRPEPMGVRW